MIRDGVLWDSDGGLVGVIDKGGEEAKPGPSWAQDWPMGGFPSKWTFCRPIGLHRKPIFRTRPAKKSWKCTLAQDQKRSTLILVAVDPSGPQTGQGVTGAEPAGVGVGGPGGGAVF